MPGEHACAHGIPGHTGQRARVLASRAIEQRERIADAQPQHGDMPHHAVRQFDLRTRGKLPVVWNRGTAEEENPAC